jgi:sn-glycerol 3-phosphate transport system permease protein
MVGTRNNWYAYLILAIGVIIFAFPIYITIIGSTHEGSVIARGQMPLTPGERGVETYRQAWETGEGARVRGTPAGIMMRNSLVMALMITVGKIAISLLSAFAVVFFSFPGRMFFFWMIFITLMLPV